MTLEDYIVQQLKDDEFEKEYIRVHEPIIRCKECKYYDKRYTSKIRGMHCLRYGEQKDADDFCSRGEKKDE